MAADTDVRWLAKLARLGVTAADIRRWARDEGLEVGVRGRLSPGLIDAYVKAHPRRQVLRTVTPRQRKRQPKVVPIPERICDWTLSDHAEQRRIELGFSRQEIMDALDRPDITYEQPKYGDGEAIIQRGELALGVNKERRIVKTVLLRRVDQWEHDVQAAQSH